MKNKKLYIIGGSILVLGVVAYLVFKPKPTQDKQKKTKPTNDDDESNGYSEDDMLEDELSFDEIEEICRYGDESNPNYQKYCN